MNLSNRNTEDLYMKVFDAILLVLAKTWKPSKYPLSYMIQLCDGVT